jgi:hypothetical protein
LETHLLHFHSTAAVLGFIEGRQNNSVDVAVKCMKIPKRVWPQLLAETEFLDHSLIAIGIVGFQIVKQATPLADQHEKTAARAVVLLVHLEVFRQGTNAFAEQRDLHFRTAGVGSMRAVLVDEGFLLLSG